MTYTQQERAAYSLRIRLYEQSPVWKRRADRFRRGTWWRRLLGMPDRNFCQACGFRPPVGMKVDVHHITYAHAFHGREPTVDLRGLCRTDHQRVHELARSGWSLADATAHVMRTTKRPRPNPKAEAGPFRKSGV